MGRRYGVVPARPTADPITSCECGTKFLWALAPSGRLIPVEVQTDFTGDLILCWEVDQADRPISGQLVMTAPPGYSGPRWAHHRARCERASLWQREQAQRGVL